MVSFPIVFIFAFVSASASFPEPSSCSSGGDEPCSLADEETVNLLQVANKNALDTHQKANQPKKQQASTGEREIVDKDAGDLKEDSRRLERAYEYMKLKRDELDQQIKKAEEYGWDREVLDKDADDQKDRLDEKDLQRLEQIEENMTVRMNKTKDSRDNKDTHRQKIKEAFELDDSEADAVESALAIETMSKALQRKATINCDSWCQSRYRGREASGYVVGTAPFCGGEASDCTMINAEKHGINIKASGYGVSGEIGHTHEKKYDVSGRTRPGPQKKYFDDGGAECSTGTKQCCCFFWKKGQGWDFLSDE